MIKLVYCITRKPGLTDEEFFSYWRNVHAPIGARIPGVRRFVQSRRISIPGDMHGHDYDGLVELWFENAESLFAARQSPEWKASTEDEANFIDHNRVAYFVSEEYTVIEG
ncbi:MAG: EthD domain-containing protein [Actinomycetota bacterium]